MIIYKGKKLEVKIINNFFNRLKGFMFKTNIDTILCFPKCNSIHTFFMFKHIDVIMTDKDGTILYVFKNFRPWKIILPKKGVYYTFEVKPNLYDFKAKEKIKVL